ncbi:hypothetical protein AAE02nite_03240 [Adhaeribacter aerolatus]|uniref:DUF4126 domain-containing protein n=1 Tax=Adhaeribacter aerolatus TaxID=670289 RepID=A0A512ASI7_9BACT|nr:DUF4126 family protein [Adhaeribacter aerolatus]GEO02660.1 hypothetical protein AAE02nite_03240 [Adhaeribacter aerolatus]
MKTSTKTYLRILGLGAVAGMRAMAAPALLSHLLVKSPAGELNFSRLHYLQLPKVANGLKLAAGAEVLGDKMPFTPNRTVPAQLGARILSGAMAGATVALANKQNKFGGFLLGGLAAAAATYVFFSLRKKLVQTTGWPDTTIALMEDTLALAGGYAIAKG